MLPRLKQFQELLLASATLFFSYNISYITVKVSSTFAISDRRRLSSINGSLQTAYKPQETLISSLMFSQLINSKRKRTACITNDNWTGKKRDPQQVQILEVESDMSNRL